MWLFFAFVAVPLVEIGLFIQVGGAIGLWPTLAIVVVTAMIGTWLMRQQGAMAMADLRSSFSEMRDPTEPLAHGAMILFAGALLLTPGFFTDAVGFLLLFPPVRSLLLVQMRKRINVAGFTAAQGRSPKADETVIDGEWQEVDPESRTNQPPSGWTKD